MAGRPVRVFLSYAHESADHAESVRRLWLLLRSSGVDAKLDVVAAGERQFWPEWMNEQVRAGDFVLVVASPAYRERAENRGDPSVGRGVRWESRQLQERFYRDQEAGLRTILPVVLPDGDAGGLPDWLLPASATVFRLREITAAGVEPLLRVLTGQPLEVEPPLGAVPVLPPRDGLTPRTELVIDVVVDGGRLISEVSLAGAPVSRREVPAVAEAGRALARAVFDEQGQAAVADLVAGLRPGDEVEVVWRAEGDGLLLPVESLELTTTAGERLGPLALLGGVSVRRQVRTAGRAGPVVAASAGPLRILAAVAAPLDAEAEMQALLDAASEAGGGVRILEVASLPQIAAALAESEFHVLHLSAHGSPEVVELEDEDGNPQPVGYRELMNAIKDARAAVPLIVMSSGGVAMAAAMIGAGADRVLVMRAPELLAAFYHQLIASRTTSVGGALGRARREIEHALATLLCAGADGPLIDAGLPRVELPVQAVPSGTSVRDLALGELIGRRAELREAGAVLRRSKQARDQHGLISGVQLIGVGGIGKTAVAGRLVTRLRDDNMIPVVHEGRWNPTALFAGIAAALGRARPDDPAAGMLAAAEVPDTAKAALVGQVLKATPVLLVFDDFEQNLTPGGGAFLDPAFDRLFTGWCDDADTGVLLVTCRYPLPGDDRYLVPVPLGPLSTAELRRLLLRLPALRGLTGDDLGLLIRTIGGHPRLIEYVDALLRGKPARLRDIQAKLRNLAAREGIDLRTPRPVGTAIEDALLLGSSDILLDELLDLLTGHEREVLRQISVSRAPMTLDDLAYALSEPGTDRLAAEVAHLADLSLLAPGPDIAPHPWTAELLERRPDPDRANRHRRAFNMRWHRNEELRLTSEDLVDIVRHLAAVGDYDRIPGIAQQAIRVLPGVLAAAAYLAEIRSLVPVAEPVWAAVTRMEFQIVRAGGDLPSANALLQLMRRVIEQRQATDPQTVSDLVDLIVDLGDLAVAAGNLTAAGDHYRQALAQIPPDEGAPIRERLGDVAVAAGDLAAARDHYQAGLEIRERVAAADSGNTTAQRDVSVTRERLGDVARAEGDLATARDHYQAALEIRQRLLVVEPHNSLWQRDLSVGWNKLGNLALDAGDLSAARDHYQASLEIRQRLADADPDNTEWQRDLSVSQDRLGHVAVAAGDLPAAREHYQASLEIAERLAAADPTNAAWQQDVSVSRTNLGNLASL